MACTTGWVIHCYDVRVVPEQGARDGGVLEPKVAVGEVELEHEAEEEDDNDAEEREAEDGARVSINNMFGYLSVSKHYISSVSSITWSSSS
jgi:hypothetical protein